ncbi:putative transcription factor & chromatin remodeling ARID family [Helianthus annuus]|uniref:Transcription factor & chromatin remodeling ARID family n=1 Tax=Helianthus annuus TaxID=4232 RepID=A0A9K3J9D6_HELAN|nr:putative transcription factor & chromatin remodeling ARID family [Helianthus annuus]KAJ0589917.1 putative transcription factor & chromatin remodeling ARID family [Helianthus annuus]KAJ0927856.1 putative transcription factor & chromatin remodeling ARID family [Helianthus annuus]KAJ0932273.1 putative transcription factor & chromatin remodeling ARID family [Helianthus annuus]
MTNEEEIGMLEKQSMMSMSNESEFAKFKTEFLNEYFENLNVSSNEPDWNIMILQSMQFKEFQDCKALLDMMDDGDYVQKYKFILESKLDEMVDWFLTKKLEVMTRPIPAYASNNRKVSLLELYLVVEREGGHRRVTENNLWAMVAKDMGFEYGDGEFMRLMYAMYLDVLVYYHKFKTTQAKVQEKVVAEVKETKMHTVELRGSKSEGDDETGTVADCTEKIKGSCDDARNDTDHFAFYAGNDWQGMRRLHTRRKFDFNRAKVAMDDANKSILMHSFKQNYV